MNTSNNCDYHPGTSKELEVLMQMIRSNEAGEWLKWEEYFNEDMSIMTLCDVRRHVEEKLGIGNFSDLQILEAIRDAHGRVTNRLESDTMDLCLVNLSRVVNLLRMKN